MAPRKTTELEASNEPHSPPWTAANICDGPYWESAEYVMWFASRR